MKTHLNILFTKSVIFTLLYGNNGGTAQSLPFLLQSDSIKPDLPLYSQNNRGEGSSFIQKTKPKAVIINAKFQIEYLRNFLGFNISQLAAIMLVQRPTIYEWLQDETPNRHNQERLNIIYSLFENWEEQNLKIGNYLYLKTFEKKSLYDFLIEKKVNLTLIKKCLFRIKSQLLLAQKDSARRKEIAKEAGFKPLRKEQEKMIINRLLRRV